MRLVNQITHYTGAVVRGIISGRLLDVAGRYLRNRRIEDNVVRHLGLTVRGGLFDGMAYIRIPAADALTAKLIGSYEHEIAPFVETALAARPDVLLNIGSAEGYYAIGMARRLPGLKVITYDTDARARDLVAALSAANGVADRVTIAGLCDHAELESRLRAASRPIVIIDCEGCEADLLDPVRSPGLTKAIMLVEVHDFSGMGLSAGLQSRFADTHTVQRAEAVPPQPERYPQLAFLSPADRLTAIDERAGAAQEWLLFQPR